MISKTAFQKLVAYLYTGYRAATVIVHKSASQKSSAAGCLSSLHSYMLRSNKFNTFQLLSQQQHPSI